MVAALSAIRALILMVIVIIVQELLALFVKIAINFTQEDVTPTAKLLLPQIIVNIKINNFNFIEYSKN